MHLVGETTVALGDEINASFFSMGKFRQSEAERDPSRSQHREIDPSTLAFRPFLVSRYHSGV
eukprot:scaffold8566_cov95-Cylindrotheca_fusiformis.AAC.1